MVFQLGPRERLREEDQFWVRLLELADAPRPEGKRLRMRIIDAENRDALLNPKVHDAARLLPQFTPRARFEIERIDVLIFLGRILRVLNRAVRPALEPLRVLANIRVVGGTLECDIEGNLELELSRLCDQPPEIVQRAQLGMD